MFQIYFRKFLKEFLFQTFTVAVIPLPSQAGVSENPTATGPFAFGLSLQRGRGSGLMPVANMGHGFRDEQACTHLKHHEIKLMYNIDLSGDK